MLEKLVALLQVLSVKGQQGGIVSAAIVLAVLLTEIGFIALIVLTWSYFGTLTIAVGVALLVVTVFDFLLAAPMYGTVYSGKDTERRHLSNETRGDV